MNKYVIYTKGNGVLSSIAVHAESIEEAKEKVDFYTSIKYFNDDLEVNVYGGKRIK